MFVLEYNPEMLEFEIEPSQTVVCDVTRVYGNQPY